MIKKSSVEAIAPERSGSRRRQNQSESVSVPLVVILVLASIASFYIGSHMRRWVRRPPVVHKISAAIVTFFPSNDESTLLIQTPGGKTVIVASDLDQSVLTPLIHTVKQRHIVAIDLVILTKISASTGGNVMWLRDQLPIVGPVITPYQPVSRPEWWQKTEAEFTAQLQQRNITAISWQQARQSLVQDVPGLNITLFAPGFARWQQPVIGAAIGYRQSSLLDLSSLTSLQVADVTGQPIGANSRVLIVNGQADCVTKELLALVQPDVVLLTGSNAEQPDSRAISNIAAADAKDITLAGQPVVTLTLPESSLQPINSSR